MATTAAEKKTIYRVQNDTGPDEQFILRRKVVNPDSGKVTYVIVDLTDYTVELVITSDTTGTVTNDGHQTCTLDGDPTTGKCTYEFIPGDLPDDGGRYTCDLQLTNGAGQVETYYGYIVIVTRAEIAT